MKERQETAVRKFLEGYNCAQSVLYAFCDDLGFDPDTGLRLATGFGAGMARSQEVCGAVSGGLLVLGLKFGRGDHDDRSATLTTYRHARGLMARFRERHGTTICRQLLPGCDLSTEDGYRFFLENDLFNRVCKECVKTVVETLEDILAATAGP